MHQLIWVRSSRHLREHAPLPMLHSSPHPAAPPGSLGSHAFAGSHAQPLHQSVAAELFNGPEDCPDPPACSHSTLHLSPVFLAWCGRRQWQPALHLQMGCSSQNNPRPRSLLQDLWCCRRRWQPALHIKMGCSSLTSPCPCCPLQVQDPSLLRFLVDMRDADIDDKQLRDDLMTMLIAGHETTAAVLTWALFELMQNPQDVAKCRQEIDAVTGDKAPGVPVHCLLELGLLVPQH